MPPKLDTSTQYPVSPLVDIETPTARWEPGKSGGVTSKDSKFLAYIKSKQPGLAPAGWRDITPYFGKQWPKSLSAWRTSASKSGYYISVKVITLPGQAPYRAILVCLNPVGAPAPR